MKSLKPFTAACHAAVNGFLYPVGLKTNRDQPEVAHFNLKKSRQTIGSEIRVFVYGPLKASASGYMMTSVSLTLIYGSANKI